MSTEKKTTGKGIVAVTGASGYVGSHVVKKLTEAGYTVRGTVRDLTNKTKVQHLKSLFPKLQLFEADLLKDGTFSKCFAGCKYVFHTASPFQMSVKDPQKDLIDPAVKGTSNVVNSALQAKVERIVLTSSVAAVRSDNKGANFVFSDKDFNETSSLKNGPYAYSKTLAEKKAWALVKAHKGNTSLVVINPSLVLGPPLSSRSDSTSIKIIRSTLDGTAAKAGGTMAFRVPTCDVEDVAEAHVRAAENPKASGRYIVSGYAATTMLKCCDILRTYFPKHKIPTKELKPETLSAPYFLDNSRVQRELGVRLTSTENSLIRMADDLIKRGLVPKA